MAPGPRLRSHSKTQVSRSGRVSKRSTKMADIDSPKGSDTCSRKKAEETQRSCKKIKVEQTMEDDSCRGWACCTDDNEIKVKHEPLEVEGEADSSDYSHDVRITGEEGRKDLGEEDRKDMGEEDRNDLVFIDINNLNVKSETSNHNQMIFDAPQDLKRSPGTRRSHSAPEASSTHLPAEEKCVGTSPRFQTISKNIVTISSTHSSSSQDGYATQPSASLSHNESHKVDNDEPLTDYGESESYVWSSSDSSDVHDYDSKRAMTPPWIPVLPQYSHFSDSDTESDDSDVEDIDSYPRAGASFTTRTTHTWSTDNTAPFIQTFTGTPGLTVPVPTTPLGFIQLFITRDLLKYLTYETNLYASQCMCNASNKTRKEWNKVSVQELAKYLGLTMLTGIVKLPAISMYWQTDKPWHVPAFNTCMTAKRYATIARYFHTHNNSAIPEDNTDRLIKVRTIMEYLTNKFKTYYIPQKHLCLDERTFAGKGYLSVKVYNPNKPVKYGVKLYMLTESETGYIFDFEEYSGIGKTTIETVMSLIAPLKNKGYHLYMDDCHNSLQLSEQLLVQGVYTCGTLRLQCGAPKDLQLEAETKLPADTTVFRRKGNAFIIVWKDKQVVSLITTCHNADTQEVERKQRVHHRDGTSSFRRVTVNKPKAICEYNKYMKGFDHFFYMVKYYQFTRKNHKQAKKLTFYFLKMAITNAFVLYQYYTTDTKKLSLLQFYKVLINSLVNFEYKDWPFKNDNITHSGDVHEDNNSFTGDSVVSPRPSGVRQPLFPSTPQNEDSSSHLQDKVQTNPSGAAAAAATRRRRIVDKPERLNKNLNHSLIHIKKALKCRVCYKSGKRKDTKYKCKWCGVALCATPCYGLYHHKKTYWVAKQ